MAQEPHSLPPTPETQTESPTPSFGLSPAISGIWGVNQRMGALSASQKNKISGE